MRYLFRAAVALCLFVIAAPFAMASDSAIPVASIIDVIRPYVTEIMSVLIAAAVAYILKVFSVWTGIKVEANHREALQSALENAARIVLGGLTDKASGRTVTSGHPVFDDALKYVIRSVPDAVDYFKLSPDRIKDMILPKLIPKAE